MENAQSVYKLKDMKYLQHVVIHGVETVFYKYMQGGMIVSNVHYVEKQ